MLINIEYPEAVTDIKDVRMAIEAGDKAGTEMEKALDELDGNIAISTAGESGIARREAILNIKPLDAATLEERRVEVMLKWLDSPIFTETILKQKLDAAIGADQYELDIDLEDKLVKCRILIMSKQILRIVRELFDKMIPLDYGILALLWSVLNSYLLIQSTYHASVTFSASVDAQDLRRQGVDCPSVAFSMETACEQKYAGDIDVRNDLWCLDGQVPLDGTRRLDAEEYNLDL